MMPEMLPFREFFQLLEFLAREVRPGGCKTSMAEAVGDFLVELLTYEALRAKVCRFQCNGNKLDELSNQAGKLGSHVSVGIHGARLTISMTGGLNASYRGLRGRRMSTARPRLFQGMFPKQ